MWATIKEKDLSIWQRTLYTANANIFQLPFWLNAFKHIGYLSPMYLEYRSEDQSGYCGMLVAKLLFIRIALIPGGPVGAGNSFDCEKAYTTLLQYLKGKGFAFVRFAGNYGEEYLNKQPLDIVRTETFPFYKDISNHFVVTKKATAEELKSGYNATAKRLINRVAKNEGYKLVIDERGEHLDKVYDLFIRTGVRKGFKYRPYEAYKALFNFNTDGENYATLYLCYYHEELVNAILIIRDKNRSLYMSGALDATHTETNDSPSFFLHYQAMLNEFYKHNTEIYDLVYTPGRFGDFKTRFHPERQNDPPPATIVLNKGKYLLYINTVLRFSSPLKKMVKSVLSRKR